MSSDLISRQAAIDALDTGLWGVEWDKALATAMLKDLPSAQPEARKTGKWIWMGEKGDSRFMCSVCKSKENVPTCNGEPTIWWYCPNCGADMREETEDA